VAAPEHPTPIDHPLLPTRTMTTTPAPEPTWPCILIITLLIGPPLVTVTYLYARLVRSMWLDSNNDHR